jgi:hypothetical protein
MLWENLMLAFWVKANTVSSLACLLIAGLAQFRWYPGLARTPEADFPAAHKRHCRALSWIAPVPMVADLVLGVGAPWWFFFTFGSGALQVPQTPAEWLLVSSLSLGFAASVLAWVSTFLIQVPLHRRLESGYNSDALSTLLRTNWIRTGAWGLKTLILGVAWCT